MFCVALCSMVAACAVAGDAPQRSHAGAPTCGVNSGGHVSPQPSQSKLGRLGAVLRALSDRVLGLHSLVLPHSKLRLALPGSYSKLLAQQLLSLQPRKALGHQADGRTGLVEDLHMHMLVAIDNATAYTRKLYRVVVTWVPLVGLPRGAAAMLATPVSAFPLLRRIASPELSRSGSHSAGLIQGVCGYPVECVPVTTADGYHIHMVRIPRRGSTKCAFFQVRCLCWRGWQPASLRQACEAWHASPCSVGPHRVDPTAWIAGLGVCVGVQRQRVQPGLPRLGERVRDVGWGGGGYVPVMPGLTPIVRCPWWPMGVVHFRFDVFLGNFRGTDDSMTPAHHGASRGGPAPHVAHAPAKA